MTTPNQELTQLRKELLKHASSLVRGSEAEDLVQEALTAIVDKSPTQPLAYGRKVITNLARRPREKVHTDEDLRQLLIRHAPETELFLHDRRQLANLEAAFESAFVWRGSGRTQLVRGTLTDYNATPALRDLIFCMRVIDRLPVVPSTRSGYRKKVVELLTRQLKPRLSDGKPRAEHIYARPAHRPGAVEHRPASGTDEPQRMRSEVRVPEKETAGAYVATTVREYDRTFLYGIRTLMFLDPNLSFESAEDMARQTWEELRVEYGEVPDGDPS